MHKEIDFENGSERALPEATMELKNVMSARRWTVANAIHQYRFERDPKERLFAFKQRCLAD